MSIQPCNEPTCSAGSAGAIELLIEPRAKDLGDFEVRRVLPASERRRIGPFVFFDHMGPARFAPGHGVNVRPHPHIGLSTLTYLFDGTILHRDSLGHVQPITPGAANWMTAGRGIVHSERTPEELVATGSTLHGLQVWLGLPRALEEMEPSFVHHPQGALPRVERPGVALHVVAGSAFGQRSPVETASETLYLAGQMERGAELDLPDEAEERAVYVAEGAIELAGETVKTGTMAVLRSGASAQIVARETTRIVVIGGAPLDGERHVWWNFVSSTQERIERAKSDWREGRFGKVPGETEFIPLPER